MKGLCETGVTEIAMLDRVPAPMELESSEAVCNLASRIIIMMMMIEKKYGRADSIHQELSQCQTPC